MIQSSEFPRLMLFSERQAVCQGDLFTIIFGGGVSHEAASYVLKKETCHFRVTNLEAWGNQRVALTDTKKKRLRKYTSIGRMSFARREKML